MTERIDVFVSSTAEDLTKYRERVADIILKLNAYPIMMETFNPTERNALQLCYDKIQESEIFIGIYAYRYGYVPGTDVTYTTTYGEVQTGDGQTSLTHWEYRWAVERRLPILLFIVDDTGDDGMPLVWPEQHREGEPGLSRLQAFKTLVKNEHVVSFFRSPDNLASKAATALSELISARDTAESPAPKGLFQAIQPPEIFSGRDAEIEVVERELTANSPVVIIRGGLGGVGKTALAAYVAQDMRSRFPDGVLWANLDTSDTLSILASFISAFGEKPANALKHVTTIDARAGYYRSLLSDKRCLVILDNAEQAAQITPFLPSNRSSRVLVTTRYALASSISNAFELPLETLSDEAAQQLLITLLGKTPGNQNASAVAQLCLALGNLPLAIRIAAGIISDLGWGYEDYLSRLQASNSLDWLSGDGTSENIRSAFSISYNHLPDERTKKAFRTLGIFPRTSFSRLAVSHALHESIESTERMLLLLIRRGLVQLDSAARDHFRLHPLMVRYASELLSDDEAQHAHLAVGNYFRQIMSLWKAEADEFVYGHPAVEGDTANGLSAVYHYFEAGQYAQAQEVLVAIADALTLQAQEAQLITWAEKLGQHIQLAPWLQLYRGEWFLRNRAMYRTGIELLEHLTPLEDFKVASAALIALAKANTREKRFDTARELLDRSRELKQSMNPPDLRGIAYIQNEIARLLFQEGADPRDVLSVHEKALSIQRESGDIRGTAFTLRKIASLQLRDLNNVKQAEELLAESERLARQAGDKVGLMAILSEQSQVLSKRQRYDDAVTLLQQALAMAGELNQPLSEAYIFKRLAGIYETVELLGEAYQQILKSKAIFDQLDPAQAQSTGEISQRLQRKMARLQNELRDVEDEIVQKEQAIAARSAAEPGPDVGMLRADLRVLRKRKKRIGQKLGIEPGHIRLGKH